MSKGNSGYFNLPWGLRLVLAIIPVTAWLVHAIARLTSGKVLGIVFGILGLIGFGFIFWIVDLITTILNKRHNLLLA